MTPRRKRVQGRGSRTPKIHSYATTSVLSPSNVEPAGGDARSKSSTKQARSEHFFTRRRRRSPSVERRRSLDRRPLSEQSPHGSQANSQDPPFFPDAQVVCIAEEDLEHFEQENDVVIVDGMCQLRQMPECPATQHAGHVFMKNETRMKQRLLFYGDATLA